MEKLNGSCLCGKVAYELTGNLLAFYHCHCQRCRKTCGSAHASNLRVDTDQITWLRGEELIKSYKIPAAERFRNDFCGNCGSTLPRYFTETGFVLLPAGTLDMEPELKPQARIFCASRATWSCDDGLTQFEEYAS